MTASRWTGLGDAEAAHREAPRTYSIPRSDQRRALRVGDLVKLVFLAEPPSEKGYTAERMWVEVKEITPSGYVGALDNQPSFIADLKPGDLVEFGPEHVIALHESPSGLPLPLGQYANVTRDILEDRAWPFTAVRQSSDQPGFSGWVVRSSAGEQDFGQVLVDNLLQQYRVLDSVLDEPVGTVWQWDPDALEYVLQQAPS